jgi:hypothetical protein
VKLRRIYKSVTLPPIRITEEAAALLRQHVEENGETLSEFVRRAIANTIKTDRLRNLNQAARQAIADDVWGDLDHRYGTLHRNHRERVAQGAQ